MLFCTYVFIAFLILFLLLFKTVEKSTRLQNVLILIASNVFYGFWDYRFLALIYISTLVDFIAAQKIHGSNEHSRRKRWLALSICVNIGLLGVFKYFNFFQQGFIDLLSLFQIQADPFIIGIILPVGISFYTFQTLSYTIDVYYQRFEPCRDLLVFSIFVCYFPQLVAGPIERAGNLIPQLAKNKRITLDNLLSGGLLIALGSFKKAFVADLIGMYIVDTIFQHPLDGIQVAIGSVAFAIQIYCDFSGYCDIARGVSRCIGVELQDNFNAPYFAESIQAFWRKWHITLSMWFRDYVYIPLGGSRGGVKRTYYNIFITMLLCGLWHGPQYTFVFWGGYHALLMVAGRILRQRKNGGEPLPFRPLRVAFTFILVCFGWLIFRSESMALLIDNIMTIPTFDAFQLEANLHYGAVTVFFGVLTFVFHLIQSKTGDLGGTTLENLPWLSPAAKGLLLGILVSLTIIFGTFDDQRPFIYFQF